MTGSPQDVRTAQAVTRQAAAMLGRSRAFQQLDPGKRTAILRDLDSIRRALDVGAAPAADPYAFPLETPNDFRNRLRRGPDPAAEAPPPAQPEQPTGPRAAATETIAARAGALSDEINFPAFVAQLVHGTFDAIVDAAIRQMEAFAQLVSSVAKDVDQFTQENITPNQARDYLAERYPRDLVLDITGDAGPQLRVRPKADGEEESPSWLSDFGLDGVPLTDEVVEANLVPAARRRVGESRLQTLASMVLLGMNRVNVKDGTISAKVRFRAVAQDKAAVDYAVSQDPGGGGWGTRGSGTYANSATMVSTVGVNVQSDSELKAELFGEVKINFVSETLPLDRFVDSARMSLLQRNARSPAPAALPPAAAPPAAAPPVPPAAATPPPPGG